MPKKFAGENTKARAAKEKKLKVNNETRLKKSQDKHEQEWVDNCKKIEKKLIRKEEKIEKRQGYLNRKSELKEILKKESDVICVTKPRPLKKLTRLEIGKKLLEDQPRSKPNKPTITESLSENLNRLTLGEEIARTIDAALALLDRDPIPNKFPEKRRKAEYKVFEEKRLKELRASHPTLKLSQLKEMIFKEWQKISQNVKYQK